MTEEEKKPRGNPNWIKKQEQKWIADIDYPKDERLNGLISEMKKILNRYQNTIETKILEDGGIIKEITITARIRP